MKKLLWASPEREIMFKVNWFECFVLKRIFNKKKYTLLKKYKLKGEKFDVVFIDEFCNLDEKYDEKWWKEEKWRENGN